MRERRRAVKSYIVKVVCRLFGHKIMYAAEEEGGERYCCDRCGRTWGMDEPC